MVLDRSRIAILLMVWAFFLGLVGFGLNWPTVLIVVGTILFLI